MTTTDIPRANAAAHGTPLTVMHSGWDIGAADGMTDDVGGLTVISKSLLGEGDV